LISRVWDISSGIGPCFFGWRIVQILRQRRRKTTNTAPTTLSAKQAASQSTLNNAQLPLLLVISGNDKNKQLKLLSQRKLSFTGRNK
jgi:hypothetical protein